MLLTPAYLRSNTPVSSPFIHLHVHSEYSLYDSVVRVKPLIARARENNMPAVALTDMANLFAVVKFYRAAVAAGIKPVIGSDEIGRAHV